MSEGRGILKIKRLTWNAAGEYLGFWWLIHFLHWAMVPSVTGRVARR